MSASESAFVTTSFNGHDGEFELTQGGNCYATFSFLCKVSATPLKADSTSFERMDIMHTFSAIRDLSEQIYIKQNY